MSDLKLAVMQPYFFPYLGYFQLIVESDLFVIYDDVNFITRGWINRNRILINGSAAYITIPCKNSSQNRPIHEIEHALDDKIREKLIRKVELAYKNAPNFRDVYPVVRDVIYTDKESISELATESIVKTLEYLSIEKAIKKSSSIYDNQQMKGSDRIMDICEQENATSYINAVGGKTLYDKEVFLNKGVDLKFLITSNLIYEQFGEKFVPGLSIIDVMMFNSISSIHEMLKMYYLE